MVYKFKKRRVFFTVKIQYIKWHHRNFTISRVGAIYMRTWLKDAKHITSSLLELSQPSTSHSYFLSPSVHSVSSGTHRFFISGSLGTEGIILFYNFFIFDPPLSLLPPGKVLSAVRVMASSSPNAGNDGTTDQVIFSSLPGIFFFSLNLKGGFWSATWMFVSWSKKMIRESGFCVADEENSCLWSVCCLLTRDYAIWY